MGNRVATQRVAMGEAASGAAATKPVAGAHYVRGGDVCRVCVREARSNPLRASEVGRRDGFFFCVSCSLRTRALCFEYVYLYLPGAHN